MLAAPRRTHHVGGPITPCVVDSLYKGLILTRTRAAAVLLENYQISRGAGWTIDVQVIAMGTLVRRAAR